ncbi:hypothetical protein DLAC_03544 [Tieghemostelium lacteum]|uniref:Mitochondrial import inner membrane translocase subunit Tim21 n=1 Tax=Tieghemostelium lacteum TaxID=361077 RepID=A0A152A1G7_TIELA|nr:hypothetical protein DLAC_03544 [Tieghemostelium lacteum]|eukprot:KYQ99956.1 hypothetical protein DLAC_03544 [Tieghemostelium lacteum]
MNSCRILQLYQRTNIKRILNINKYENAIIQNNNIIKRIILQQQNIDKQHQHQQQYEEKRYYGSRSFDPQQEYKSRRIIDSFGSTIGLLAGGTGLIACIYFFYNEIIIHQMIYSEAVDELRKNEKTLKLFGNNFIATGMGLRSETKYKSTETIENDKIILNISFLILGENGKNGTVDCKVHKISTFKFKILSLRVSSGSYIRYNVIGGKKEAVPKKIMNSIFKYFGLGGSDDKPPTTSNADNSNKTK